MQWVYLPLKRESPEIVSLPDQTRWNIIITAMKSSGEDGRFGFAVACIYPGSTHQSPLIGRPRYLTRYTGSRRSCRMPSNAPPREDTYVIDPESGTEVARLIEQ